MPFSHPYHNLPESIRIRSHASLPADLEVDPALHAMGHRLSYRSTEAPELARDPEVPFQPAMERLHGTLTEAVEFFGEIMADFKRETDSIMSYTRPEVLDEVWRCKVRNNVQVAVVPFTTKKKKKKKKKRKKTTKKKVNNERKGAWSLGQRLMPRWHEKRRAKARGKEKSRAPKRHHLDRIVRIGYKDWVNRVQHDLSLVETARWPTQQMTDDDRSSDDDTPVIETTVDGLSQLQRIFIGVCPDMRRECRDIDRVESCEKFITDAERFLLAMAQNESWWRPLRDERSGFRRWWFF
ncbi:uncharacterized protein ACLA_079800 [Aspergillus clavatus NRRL 1]|uniref:Uncharacterized protein n=1 Tax=Aspergillus clavatus (strain ATCC 1007 / CBS 513.65 / DSM 816 / NCTC 3887 / NRRL 1 / QM 1276 / 107) TaxID=344612 RepID=A1CSK9_ASPCL|nr:uncharacterized protein ACLA_079800 [Aspergillus clavatus NRRL 1]EAW06296.1 conserved hypothetical protein [Aspergillus clavatus NRRL 1]